VEPPRPSPERLLDRLLALAGASLLAYLLASHTVRSFVSDASRFAAKVISVLGGS
jgi:hypothetical protein